MEHLDICGEKTIIRVDAVLLMGAEQAIIDASRLRYFTSLHLLRRQTLAAAAEEQTMKVSTFRA